MQNYAIASIDTNLFFARIMREHAIFLMAGFPCKNESWIQKADSFREQFENLLREVVKISDYRVSDTVLRSNEIVTEFTISAEKKTEYLTGISIDSSISEQQHKLCAWDGRGANRRQLNFIHQINRQALNLLNGFISFKESILREVKCCSLYTTNYPLLIEHILREAKLYRAIIQELLTNHGISQQKLCETELFWNQIMMEHALFIRGLLDPSETELIHTADDFAKDYERLLETAKEQDCQAMDALTQAALNKTIEYRDFKATGTDGILHCKIDSVILPLLADHVLREANHYIRLLSCSFKG